MASDFIPRADGTFAAWLENFYVYANANQAALGLAAGDLTALAAARGTWKTAYPGHNAAQAAAQAARQAKDSARGAVQSALRPLVRRLQASDKVNDGERAALGITVPDRTPTPVRPPTTQPIVRVDVVGRLRHTLHFSDAATPTRKARPAGVLGAEIWVKILPVGEPPPSDPATLSFVALDRRTPFSLDFAAADGGKNAHYLLRWLSTRGETGPWSETATATIGV